MPVPNSSTGGKISMKCIANEYGFSENTIPLSLDDLSNLIAKDRKHAMSEFSTCEFEDTATWLLIGGGGGGGSNIGGGGGAGGYTCGSWDIASLLYSGSSQTVNIIIGGGGSKATSWSVSATNGSSSSFNTPVLPTVVSGGGGSGGNAHPYTNCADAILPQNGIGVGALIGTGGSGGGGSGNYNDGTINLGASGSDGGNNGGNGYGDESYITRFAGGGGGGSCCIGGNAAKSAVGIGGLGCRTIVKGLQEVYSNGGTGSSRSLGIGSDASINTGNGGESGGSFGDDGGNGGSGLFVVSYYSPDGSTKMSGGDSVTQVDNRVIHTFNNSGTLTIGNPVNELNVEYLVVGSGGGVCLDTQNYTDLTVFFATGGAGGGQVLEGSSTLYSNCQYSIIIGAGGTSFSSNISSIRNTTTSQSIASAYGGESIVGLGTTSGGPASDPSTSIYKSSMAGESYFITSGCANISNQWGACCTPWPTGDGCAGGVVGASDSTWKSYDDTLHTTVNFNNILGTSLDVTSIPYPTGGGGGAGGNAIAPIYQINPTIFEDSIGVSTLPKTVVAKAGYGGPGKSPTNFTGTFGGGGGGTFMSGVMDSLSLYEQIFNYTSDNSEFCGPGIFSEFNRLAASDFSTVNNIQHIFLAGKGGTGGGGWGGFIPTTNSFTRNSTTYNWSTCGGSNTGGGAGGISPNIYESSNNYCFVHANNGGSGVVAIRYLGNTALATGGTITCSGGYVYHCFTGSGTFTLL